LRVPNSGAARQLDAPSALPVGVWTHVAVVFHPQLMQLLIDGKVVASQFAPHLLPEDVGATSAYLGRSQFSADPYFRGQLDNVVLSTRSLTVSELLESTMGISGGAGGLTLSWPAWRNGLGLHRSGDLQTWTPVGTTPVATEGVDRVTLPMSGGREFFRLQFPE
jgi:hypothetical protein